MLNNKRKSKIKIILDQSSVSSAAMHFLRILTLLLFLVDWYMGHPVRRRDLSLLYGIYPGTKWCGKGNIATGPTDFGKLRDVDMCCMKHDNCPMSIMPGEKKYGIKNNGLYPISHCGCDDELYNCLHRLSNNDDAQFLGEIFFDILRMRCFIKEYPKQCVEWHWWGTCKKEKEIKSSKPIVQVRSCRLDTINEDFTASLAYFGLLKDDGSLNK